MAYLALYREWRPKRFADIVGQEHVTKTLINALKQKKVAHAYLFSGPRGTGKTTAAKILAKALNCEQAEDVEPCNQCASCINIDQGSAIEVFEIDAASNRGIDEIRDLRENIKLSSVQGKYKVYIIDEVHMLTTEAFNALLKTLEEPPPQVVFILATTEVQKIPLTILSRVQRFEFHRISVEDIQSRLSEVCDSLNRQVSLSALLVIAQKSEGGLRDALSILDQCLIQDDPIGVEEVFQVMGLVGETFSSQLVEALLISDYGRSLTLLSEGIQQGQDPRQIIRELLDYLRQMLLTAATGETPLVAPHIQDKLVQQSEQMEMSRLLRWIAVLLQGESQLKYASNARLAAELLLVQTIHETESDSRTRSASITGTDEVSRRLTAIEQFMQDLRLGHRSSYERKIAATTQAGRSVLKEQTLPPKMQPEAKTIHLDSRENTNESNVNIKLIQDRWDDVLEQVKKRKKSTQAFLLEGKPANLEGNTLTIVFREGCSFHKDKVNQQENRQTIEDVLRQLFGQPLAIQNFMENEYEETAEPLELKTAEQVLVDKARDIFGSDIVVVKEE